MKHDIDSDAATDATTITSLEVTNPQKSHPKLWNTFQKMVVIYTILAGYTGASIFTYSVGLYVTFMTGNAEKNVLGFFSGQPQISLIAMLLTVSFALGALSTVYLRKNIWKNHPYSVILLTAIALAISSIFTSLTNSTDMTEHKGFLYLALATIAYGTGALNGAFTFDGFTVSPITYHTGTLVKSAQGIGKHLFHGGNYRDWISFVISYLSFSFGATLGGITSLYLSSTGMLIIAASASFIIFLCVFHIEENVVDHDS